MRLIVILAVFACSVFAGLSADLDKDGCVNFNDFVIMAQQWGDCDMANNYLTFNGTDQYVEIASDAANNMGVGDFSICFWLKPTTKTNAVLFNKQNRSPGYGIYLGDNLSFSIFDGVGEAGAAIYDYSTVNGEFHHIIAARDNTALNLYLDNALVATASITAGIDLDNVLTLIIGGGAYYYNGLMDDIRIYKSALTEAERAEIYNDGKGAKYAALSTTKTANWASDCDTGTGDVLEDAVGDVDGTLYNNSVDNMWESGGVPFDINGPLFLISQNWKW